MYNRQIQLSGNTSNFSNHVRQGLKSLFNENGQAPEKIRMHPSNWTDKKPTDRPIDIYPHFTDINPNQKRILYGYTILDPDSVDKTTCIDILEITNNRLKKTNTFKFNNLDISYDVEHETNLNNFRQAQFMGNDHIAMALATGHVRILSIPKNEIFLDEKIAGLVSNLTCSEKYMAASLFPGIEDKYYFACGVKVYSIQDIIDYKRFEARYVLQGESFSILPHSIRLAQKNDRILCKGSRILPNGYVNFIEEYSLTTDKLTTLLEEEDEDISHRISNYSQTGEYCSVSLDGLFVKK